MTQMFDISSISNSEGEYFTMSGVSISYNWHDDPIESYVDYTFYGVIQVNRAGEDINKEGLLQKEDITIWIDTDESRISNDSIIAWWKLDEGSGTTALDSIGINNGIISGAIYSTNSINGYSLSFAGASADRVLIPFVSTYPSAAQPRSLTCWINKSASATGTDSIFGYGNSASNQMFGLITTAGILWFWGWVAPADFSTGITIENDVWIHFVVTYDGTTLKFYKNGVFAYSKPRAINTILTSGAIGANPWFNNFAFQGLIDDVRLYDCALSPEEIEKIYKNTVSVVNMDSIQKGNYVTISTSISGVFQITNVVRNPGHVRIEAKRILV